MKTNKLTSIIAAVAVVAAMAPLAAFAQTVPTITSLSPSTVNVGTGAFTMTVNGSGFVSGATVNINGSVFAANSIAGNQLTVSVPATSIASTGTFPVSVSNSGSGTSNTMYLTVAANGAPAISSISPMGEPTGTGMTTVTVNGNGFTSASTVTFNGSTIPSTYVSGNQLQVALPSSAMSTAGTYNLSVTTPGVGTSGTVPYTVYTNVTPTITSVSPASISANTSGMNVTVNGAGFNPASVVTFNGTTENTVYVSPTQLVAALPAAALSSSGTFNVGVFNSGAGSSNTAAFTVTAASTTTPFITSVSPSQVTMGSGSAAITVMGSGFMSGSVISFAGSSLATTYVSPTELTATVPSTLLTTSEYAPVSVTNPGVGVSNAVLFTVAGAASGTPTLPNTGFAPQSAFNVTAAAVAVLMAMGAVAAINRKKLFVR